MKARYLPILIFLLFGLRLHSQEELINLKTPTGDVEGTLLKPEAKGKIPVVLLVSGSGPTDRNGNQSGLENNSLKMLAEEMAKTGLASLRYDKRGVAHSSAAGTDEGEMRLDTFVNDVINWAVLLANDKRFSRVIVAGHSEGSLLGLIAANRTKKISALISIAGAGRAADEIIKEQLNMAPEKIKASLYPMLDKVKNGDTVSDVPPIFYAFLRPGIQPYLTSWFKYNPQTEIAKLSIPILIVQGTTDLQVKEKDAELLAQAQPKATLKLIKNMNHVLKDAESTDKESQKNSYANPELPLNKEFVKEINAFLINLPKEKK